METMESHAESEEVVSLVLYDESGNEYEGTVLNIFEHNNKMYAVVQMDREDFEGAFMMRIDNDGEEDVFVDIEDEDEWQSAVDAYGIIAGQSVEAQE